MADVNEDLQTYPILIEEVDLAPRSRGAGEVAPGEFAGVVDRALSDVLGWRPNVRDPKSFVAALNSSFSREEERGHTTWQWTPRSFTVYTEMGAVTGAQASILARAQAAAEKALPLLEGLTPLINDADEDDTAASAAILRSHVQEVVRELAEIGGPRVQRVDTLFESLLGPGNPNGLDFEQVGGQLGVLRDRLGLERSRVNTIDEEQNLTNFLILVDHIFSLRQSWLSHRSSFDRDGEDTFLGTQLVLLSRALSVVSESVRETEFVMNSVFLGPAERQTTQLSLCGNEPTLTIAELLEWIDHVASDEGPRLIREAGKDGVIALTPTLRRLDELVAAAAELAQSDSSNPTPGFHTVRVHRALDELHTGVSEAFRLATQLRRFPGPEVLHVSPDHAVEGRTVRLLVAGKGFQDPPTVTLEADASQSSGALTVIEGRNVAFLSPFALSATFDLTAIGAPSLWTVVVRNPDLGEGRRERALIVEAAATAKPKVATVHPSSGRAGSDVEVVVIGTRLYGDTALSLEPSNDVWLSNVEVESLGIALRATFHLGPAAAGDRVVVARNPDGQMDKSNTAFKIEPQPPELKSIDHASGSRGQKVKVTVTGQGLSTGTELRFEPSDVQIVVEAVEQGGTEVHATVTIDSKASLGPHYLFAENAGGKSPVPQVFTVV